MNFLGKAVTRTRFGYSAGFRFVGDNKIVPILYHGLFDRFEGPGHFWISPVEDVLGPIHIGIQAADFEFIHVLSSDRIPHKVSMNAVYQQNPRQAERSVQPGLAKLPTSALRTIINNQADSILRMLFGQYTAEQLTRPRAKLELNHELYRQLSTVMRWAGVAFIEQEVFLKAVVPPKFQMQSIMNEHDMRIFMALAAESGDSDLMERVSRIHRQYGLAANGNAQAHFVEYGQDHRPGDGDSRGNGSTRPSRGKGPNPGILYPKYSS